MNDETSLDRMHDIVTPPDVSLFPLAPGWYFVLFLFGLTIGLYLSRLLKRWTANEYRREALRQLDSSTSPAAISTILRRTALSTESRTEIAALTGEEWPDWLARQCSTPMPTEVRSQLCNAGYSDREGNRSTSKLHDYAVEWITQHQVEETAQQHRNPIGDAS